MAKNRTEESPSLPTMENTVPTKPKVKRGLDAELQAMARIDRILSELDGDQVSRTLAWLLARHTQGRFRLILGADEAKPSANGSAPVAQEQ